MRLLVRTEADFRIGLGHLQRSISLAKALEEQGVRCRFLVNGSAENLSRLSECGLEAEAMEGNGSGKTEGCIRKALDWRADGVWVDLPRVFDLSLRRFQKAGLRVMLRDDLGGRAFPCSLLVNGNADALALKYGRRNGRTRFLLGPEYLVLPEEFREPRRRRVKREVTELLITLGGADPLGRMSPLIRWVDGLEGDFSVTAVLGPFVKDPQALERAISCARHRIRIVPNPASLGPLIWKADVAVSAAGQTLYELACAGCPAVAIRVASNQEGQLRALEKAGTVRVAGSIEQKGLRKGVQAAVTSLLRNTGARRSMAEAGQRLVDGQGGFRVAREILEFSDARR